MDCKFIDFRLKREIPGQVYFCTMIQGIRHVIFDLGGVLLNIDYQLTEKAFIRAGMSDFSKLYSQLKQTPLFDEFETGKISETDFIQQLQQLSPVALSPEQTRNAWNAMLLDLPLRRLQLLQQLRLYYDLVLLSNTNIIHETAFTQSLQQAHGITLGGFFDKLYYSHRIGLRKPDPEVFRLVLTENNFNPAHTLFIDDSPQHIEGAKTLGIQTIFLDKGMTIEQDIFRPKKT